MRAVAESAESVASRPDLAHTQLRGDLASDRVLVVGPSLGTGVAQLWERCVELLPATWQVIGWDLPGHGASSPTTGAFKVQDIAASVRERAAAVAAGRPVAYAGVSFGGAVGFALALDPGPVGAVVALASAPRIGIPDAWHERAALVRRAGTSAVVAGSAERWFAPGFLAREPDAGGALLMALREVDAESYALACEALAAFDVRERLDDLRVRTLVAGGAGDVVIDPAGLDVAMDGVAHLPPIEDPAATADLITRFLTWETA